MVLNPMMGILNQSRLSGLMSQIAPIKQMMGMVQSSGNPQMMIQQMLGNNPQYAQIQKLISDNGGDAQRAFYSLANQMGVDPNEVLNALR